MPNSTNFGSVTGADELYLTVGSDGKVTIKTLGADPNADRILFWDDSASAIKFLTAGTGLSISGTTITNTSVGATILSDTRIAGAAANFDITGLTTGFSCLEIELQNCKVTTANDGINLTFNNDGGANYDYQFSRNINTTISSLNSAGQTVIRLANNVSNTAEGSFIIRVTNTASAFKKDVLWSGGDVGDTLQWGHATWNNTADEITRVTIAASTTTLQIGTRLIIRGIV